MGEQLDLALPASPGALRPWPEADRLVAAKRAGGPAAALQRRILEVLARGPATTGELALALAAPRDSISPRMRELAREGYVRNTGHTKSGSAGRAQRVWERT